MNATSTTINLVLKDKLRHTTKQDRRVMSELERIGLLVSIASQEGASSDDVTEAVEAASKLIERRNGRLAKSIQAKAGVKVKRVKPMHVYLMHHGLSDVWKIGRSTNPTCRERTLQHADPQITMVWSVQECGSLEGWLHERFANKRLRGEWFNLSDEDVEWIQSKAVEAYNERKA
jgi:hypothetical protein